MEKPLFLTGGVRPQHTILRGTEVPGTSPGTGRSFKGASPNPEITADHFSIRHELGRWNRQTIEVGKEKIFEIEPGIG